MARLMTIAEVAERLNVSEWKVRDLARKGEIPHQRIGGLVRFREADIEAYENGVTQWGYTSAVKSGGSGSSTEGPSTGDRPAKPKGAQPKRSRKGNVEKFPWQGLLHDK